MLSQVLHGTMRSGDTDVCNPFRYGIKSTDSRSRVVGGERESQFLYAKDGECFWFSNKVKNVLACWSLHDMKEFCATWIYVVGVRITLFVEETFFFWHFFGECGVCELLFDLQPSEIKVTLLGEAMEWDFLDDMLFGIDF